MTRTSRHHQYLLAECLAELRCSASSSRELFSVESQIRSIHQRLKQQKTLRVLEDHCNLQKQVKSMAARHQTCSTRDFQFKVFDLLCWYAQASRLLRAVCTDVKLRTQTRNLRSMSVPKYWFQLISNAYNSWKSMIHLSKQQRLERIRIKDHRLRRVMRKAWHAFRYFTTPDESEYTVHFSAARNAVLFRAFRSYTQYKIEMKMRLNGFIFKSGKLSLLSMFQRLKIGTGESIKFRSEYSKNLVQFTFHLISVFRVIQLSASVRKWQSAIALMAYEDSMVKKFKIAVWGKRLAKAFQAIVLFSDAGNISHMDIEDQVRLADPKYKRKLLALDKQRRAANRHAHAAITALRFYVTYVQYLSTAASIVVIRLNKRNISCSFQGWRNSLEETRIFLIDVFNQIVVLDLVQLYCRYFGNWLFGSKQSKLFVLKRINDQKFIAIDNIKMNGQVKIKEITNGYAGNVPGEEHSTNDGMLSVYDRQNCVSRPLQKRRAVNFFSCLMYWKKVRCIQALVRWSSCCTFQSTNAVKAYLKLKEITIKLKFFQYFELWRLKFKSQKHYLSLAAVLRGMLPDLRTRHHFQQWINLVHRKCQLLSISGQILSRKWKWSLQEMCTRWREATVLAVHYKQTILKFSLSSGVKCCRRLFANWCKLAKLVIKSRSIVIQRKRVILNPYVLPFDRVIRLVWKAWSRYLSVLNSTFAMCSKSNFASCKNTVSGWKSVALYQAGLSRNLKCILHRNNITLRKRAIHHWSKCAKQSVLTFVTHDNSANLKQSKLQKRVFTEVLATWICFSFLKKLSRKLIHKRCVRLASETLLEWVVKIEEAKFMGKKQSVAAEYHSSHLLIKCIAGIRNMVSRARRTEVFTETQALRRKIDAMVLWYLFLRIQSLHIKARKRLAVSSLQFWRSFCLFDKKISTMQYLAMLQKENKLIQTATRGWMECFYGKKQLRSRLYNHLTQRNFSLLVESATAWFQHFQHNEYLALIERKIYLFVVGSLVARVLALWHSEAHFSARRCEIFRQISLHTSEAAKSSALECWHHYVINKMQVQKRIQVACMHYDQRILLLHMEAFIEMVIIRKSAMYFSLVIRAKANRYVLAAWTGHVRLRKMQVSPVELQKWSKIANTLGRIVEKESPVEFTKSIFTIWARAVFSKSYWSARRSQVYTDVDTPLNFLRNRIKSWQIYAAKRKFYRKAVIQSTNLQTLGHGLANSAIFFYPARQPDTFLKPRKRRRLRCFIHWHERIHVKRTHSLISAALRQKQMHRKLGGFIHVWKCECTEALRSPSLFVCAMWFRSYHIRGNVLGRKEDIFFSVLLLSGRIRKAFRRKAFAEWKEHFMHMRIKSAFIGKIILRHRAASYAKLLRHWNYWVVEKVRRYNLNHLHKMNESRLKDAVLSVWLDWLLECIRRRSLEEPLRARAQIRYLQNALGAWKAKNDSKSFRALANSVFAFQHMTKFLFKWRQYFVDRHSAKTADATLSRLSSSSSIDSSKTVWDRWEIVNLSLQQGEEVMRTAFRPVIQASTMLNCNEVVEDYHGPKTSIVYMDESMIVDEHNGIVSACFVRAGPEGREAQISSGETEIHHIEVFEDLIRKRKCDLRRYNRKDLEKPESADMHQSVQQTVLSGSDEKPCFELTHSFGSVCEQEREVSNGFQGFCPNIGIGKVEKGDSEDESALVQSCACKGTGSDTFSVLGSAGLAVGKPQAQHLLASAALGLSHDRCLNGKTCSFEQHVSSDSDYLLRSCDNHMQVQEMNHTSESVEECSVEGYAVKGNMAMSPQNSLVQGESGPLEEAANAESCSMCGNSKCFKPGNSNKISCCPVLQDKIFDGAESPWSKDPKDAGQHCHHSSSSSLGPARRRSIEPRHVDALEISELPSQYSYPNTRPQDAHGYKHCNGDSQVDNAAKVDKAVKSAGMRRSRYTRHLVLLCWQERALLSQQVATLAGRVNDALTYRVLVSWIRLHSAHTVRLVSLAHRVKTLASATWRAWRRVCVAARPRPSPTVGSATIEEPPPSQAPPSCGPVT